MEQKGKHSLFAKAEGSYRLYGIVTHRRQRPADHHGWRDTNVLVLLMGFPGTSMTAFRHTLPCSCVILLCLCLPSFPAGHPVSHAQQFLHSTPTPEGPQGRAFTKVLRAADPSVLGGFPSSSPPSQELKTRVTSNCLCHPHP